MRTNDSAGKRFDKRGVKTILLTLLALVGTLVVQFVGLLVVLVLRLPEDGLAATGVLEAFCASGAVLAMLALGGGAWLRPSRADVAQALGACRPLVIANAVLMGIGCISFVADGTTVSANLLPNLVGTGLLCLGIGIFEEVLFRGVILNALLGVAGRSYRGTMVAILITSLLFGLSHVDLAVDFSDALRATQAVLKVVQCGLYSVLLCGIVLRTRRLGGVCIVHGLCDLLLMVPDFVLAGDVVAPAYVSGGDEGIATIVVYLVAIVLYLPLAIREMRKLRSGWVVYRGAFVEHADLRRERAQARRQALAALHEDLPSAA